MTLHKTLLAATLGLAICGTAAAAKMSFADAEDLMTNAGMTDISALDYRDDAWVATARDRDGNLVAVRVDPESREVTWNRHAETTVTRTTTTTREDRPVVVEEVIEPPVVRAPVVVENRVIVPVGERLSKNDVRRVLAANGYHDIHDIDWKKHRGFWKAEVRDPSGDKLEVRVDPVDGRILHVEDD